MNQNLIIDYFGVATIVLLILNMFINVPPNDNKAKDINPPTADAPAIQIKKADYIFDIPSLFGKNIDEIRKTLGKPADGNMTDPTKEQMRIPGPNMTWDNSFEKNGYTLNVEFIVATRKVTSFFISQDSGAVTESKKDELMAIGNLKNDDKNYVIKFVPVLKDPSSYTGVEITTQAVAQAADARKQAIQDAENYTAEVSICAEKQVKNMLKAPSTADFPWSSGNVSYDLDKKTYKVSSYVDAENSFGAKIRSYYNCTVSNYDPSTHSCSSDCRIQ